MPALNFTQFVDQVESGAKRCTIRTRRKRPICAGDKLHLFTGMRTNQCRKLKVVECTATTPIEIDGERVTLAGIVLFKSEVDHLARRDGFATTEDFLMYFNHHASRKVMEPFRGELIAWTL